MKKFLLIFSTSFIVCIFSITGSFAAEFLGTWYPWMGTHWDPGADTAENNYNDDGDATFPEPDGYATWSYDNALTGLYIGNEVEALNTALTWWSDVSGFSFGYAGDGMIGDIHVTIGDLGTGSNGAVILAEAFNPNTADNFGDPSGELGGNITFTTNSQVSWYDNPDDISGDGMYDFLTDALHETGHALGLDHPSAAGSLPPSLSVLFSVSESIMELYNQRNGAMNALSKYDIYLIQELYSAGDFTPWTELADNYLYTGASIGPPPNGVVPEPTTIFLLGTGLLCLARLGRKNRLNQ